MAFQSSFELTGYITEHNYIGGGWFIPVSKLFRAYGLYNDKMDVMFIDDIICFKALSSLRVI